MNDSIKFDFTGSEHWVLLYATYPVDVRTSVLFCIDGTGHCVSLCGNSNNLLATMITQTDGVSNYGVAKIKFNSTYFGYIILSSRKIETITPFVW